MQHQQGLTGVVAFLAIISCCIAGIMSGSPVTPPGPKRLRCMSCMDQGSAQDKAACLTGRSTNIVDCFNAAVPAATWSCATYFSMNKKPVAIGNIPDGTQTFYRHCSSVARSTDCQLMADIPNDSFDGYHYQNAYTCGCDTDICNNVNYTTMSASVNLQIPFNSTAATFEAAIAARGIRRTTPAPKRLQCMTCSDEGSDQEKAACLSGTSTNIVSCYNAAAPTATWSCATYFSINNKGVAIGNVATGTQTFYRHCSSVLRSPECQFMVDIPDDSFDGFHYQNAYTCGCTTDNCNSVNQATMLDSVKYRLPFNAPTSAFAARKIKCISCDDGGSPKERTECLSGASSNSVDCFNPALPNTQWSCASYFSINNKPVAIGNISDGSQTFYRHCSSVARSPVCRFEADIPNDSFDGYHYQNAWACGCTTDNCNNVNHVAMYGSVNYRTAFNA